MESGYVPVMRLAVEDPEWLSLVKAASEFAGQFGNHFSGKWILERAQAGWFPNLKALVTRGILEKEYSNASGTKAYYRLRDAEGTGRALSELGLITI
jgi:hypothetical protein